MMCQLGKVSKKQSKTVKEGKGKRGVGKGQRKNQRRYKLKINFIIDFVWPRKTKVVVAVAAGPDVAISRM